MYAKGLPLVQPKTHALEQPRIPDVIYSRSRRRADVVMAAANGSASKPKIKWFGEKSLQFLRKSYISPVHLHYFA